MAGRLSIRCAYALLGTALSIASPSAAQLNGSASGFSDAPAEANETQYWDMMGTLGTCLASQKSDLSRAFLVTAIGSPAETAAFGKLFNRNFNTCLGNFVSAQMLRAHVRGLVAEGLFERLPDETIGRFIAAPAKGPTTIATLHDVAACYVASHPDRARALLRETRVSTRGEAAFVQARVAPDLAPCLPEGRSGRIRPVTLRMALAEALYRGAIGLPPPTIETKR